MGSQLYFKLIFRSGVLFLFVINSLSAFSQPGGKVNLMEKLKPAGIPVQNFTEEPLISLTGYNYKHTAFSNDLNYMAVSRSYSRKESEVMDIVLIKLKNNKEFVLLDTMAMIRYGRPNGFLYELYFNDQQQLIAKISDGMEGFTTLTFDPEKQTVVKDEYQEEYLGDGEGGDEDILYEEKMADLKRLFPHKSNSQLSGLVYKMREVDSVGYFVQGILPENNSIFFLPHLQGKLKLIHDISDPRQQDNLNGVWGTREKVFYILKDKSFSYLFRYDLKSNVVTLLEKYPLHSHFSYIYSYELKNKEVLLTFEVEMNKPEANELLKLFKFSNGTLYRIENYPFLQEISYLPDQNLLLIYYLKDGKRCLDVRNLNR